VEVSQQLSFGVVDATSSSLVRWFAHGFRRILQAHNHTFVLLRDREDKPERSAEVAADAAAATDQVRLVLNLADLAHPRTFHRRGQGTFVVTILAAADPEALVMNVAYPALVRSLSNLVIYIRQHDDQIESHFITIEQGHYTIQHQGNDDAFFEAVYQRVAPLAGSRLVINNEFIPDLPSELWHGDAITQQLAWAGRQLDALGLLPAAFPLKEYLSDRDLRHVRLLYGIGGLSYGNLSARVAHDPTTFWMSASGVNKGDLQSIGRDILLVTGFDEQRQCMRLSVPPHIEPRRVSVDAIEHFMIYREHPAVGAIVHMHAWWRDPIPSTEVNYPCGTIELACEVAELVRHAADPSRAVIGLKNHGLTITGHSISEIFSRIEGQVVRHIPME
jgi:ribulose-5-phosphate 4-epimerase/fuculose-1-phosphate aldolase